MSEEQATSLKNVPTIHSTIVKNLTNHFSAKLIVISCDSLTMTDFSNHNN